MIDTLRAMAVFAKVAEVGSFAGAARQLGLSASVVSHHVSAIERHLNTPLIYRTTRKLSLTEAGETLAASAREMVNVAETGLRNIGRESGELVGRLTITAPAILQYARFLVRLSTFKRHNPRVELSINFTDRQVNIVEEGVDLGFRVGWLKDSSLMARKVTGGREFLCAAPDYLNSVGAVTHPQDLARLDVIQVAQVPTKAVLTHADMRRASVQMKSTVKVDSGFAARRMAEEGCGLVKLPDFFLRESVQAGRLIEVLPDWQFEPYGIFAVWPDNVGQNRTRTALLDFVAAIAKTDETEDRTYRTGS
ncbi:MAG: LysR family transcriptional regulator [Pseudomonadota bacterium]